MSLNSAMQAGVSGLVANSVALATVSNNIANVNTIGYKQDNTQFESLVSAGEDELSLGSGGVSAITQQMIDQQGQPQQTSSPLDMAISGQGFFVVTNAANQASASTPALFTRAGSFTKNNQGYLVNSQGFFLQGWLADANGNINTNSSSLSSLQPINVAQVGGAVAPTTTVSIGDNVDSSQAVSAGAATYNASSNSMAMYETDNTTGTPPDVSIQIPISDSQGGQHNVQLEMLKTSTPNTWQAEIVAIPASDVAGVTDGQIASGTIVFNSTGQIDTANSTLLSGTNGTINIGASGSGGAGASWATSLGVAAQSINLNLAGGATSGGLTQLDSQSNAPPTVITNGTAFGTLTNVNVSSTGVVTAVYSNGVTRPLALVAIATFPDPDGLTAENANTFQVSQASGNFVLQQAGVGAAGTIDPANLESSTVDLSSQLTDLITSQSAYSACSKIITTANQMMQTLLNVIQ